MTRAIVFHRKFCQSPWASLQNPTAYTVAKSYKFRESLRPSICKWTELYSVQKLYRVWLAGCLSDIVLSCASNGQRKLPTFFVLKVQFVKMCCVYLRTIVPYCDSVSRAQSFWQFSLIVFVTKTRQQVKSRINRQRILNVCKIPWNSMELSKFCGKGKIPWFGSKICGPQKTVGSSYDCNQLLWTEKKITQHQNAK